MEKEGDKEAIVRNFPLTSPFVWTVEKALLITYQKRKTIAVLLKTN